MSKYLIPVLALVLLIPSVTFAATPNQQYVSFLEQQIAQLEAELNSIQATSTPATSTGSAIPQIPAGSCIDWGQNFAGKFCVERMAM
jgi:hypothetical protein